MSITSGRKEPCKNNAGGIDKIWLFTYVDYDVRDIQGYRDQLITSFPDTQMYLYEGQNKAFEETMNNEMSYDQKLSMRLIKQDLLTAGVLNKLVKNKVRALIQDRMGRYRLVGCVNGLDVELTAQTGGSKSDFNGYDLTMEGLEEFQAPFVESLESTGLTERVLDLECILASSSRLSSISNRVSDCNVAA
jgi:hypothetical protein